MSRRIGHITIALATLVLSGCGADNPAPPPLPTASQSASPTAATPPVMPDSARGTTRAAAKEFVRYYFTALSYATSSGDTKLLRTLGSPGCKSCSAVASRIESIYDAGGRVEGEGYVFVGAKTQPSPTDGTAAVNGTLVNLPQRMWSASDTAPSESPRSTDLVSFLLSHKDGEWVIEQWTRVG